MFLEPNNNNTSHCIKTTMKARSAYRFDVQSIYQQNLLGLKTEASLGELLGNCRSRNAFASMYEVRDEQSACHEGVDLLFLDISFGCRGTHNSPVDSLKHWD